MGDFLLDLRPPSLRAPAAAAARQALRWCDASSVESLEFSALTLTLSRVDAGPLWSPFLHGDPGRRIAIALAGRLALEETEWSQALQFPGSGGAACKALFTRYQSGGLGALESLNGNFAAIIIDEPARLAHLVTDRCGMLLAYAASPQDTHPVVGSHPDVLAQALDRSHRFDPISLAEFVATGKLSFPYTYYQDLHALPWGTAYSFPLDAHHGSWGPRKEFFRLQFAPDHRLSDADLALQFASAFRNAILRRSLPALGPVGVAVSGGLDSRAVLASLHPDASAQAFVLFDQENTESRVARRVADACHVPLHPIPRDFDHYGVAAELGTRISGAAGSFASNHFLAARRRLAQLGIQNLLTGCYCDYVFKALALNTREQPWTRTEVLAPFRFEFYRPVFWEATSRNPEIEQRLRAHLPPAAFQNRPLSEDDWLQIEYQRTFPFAYEGDCAQRLIPQRVLPWFVPLVDNDLLDLYRRLPSRRKLNTAIFEGMLQKLCPRELLQIPNSNTGARVGASRFTRAIHRYRSALLNRVQSRLGKGMASRGSWPNWDYYLRHSDLIQRLWTRPNPDGREVLRHAMPLDAFDRPAPTFQGRQVELFVRLLTLKLWLDQRFGVPPDDASLRD